MFEKTVRFRKSNQPRWIDYGPWKNGPSAEISTLRIGIKQKQRQSIAVQATKSLGKPRDWIECQLRQHKVTVNCDQLGIEKGTVCSKTQID